MTADFVLSPLGAEDLLLATALLEEALPFDRAEVVAREKLLGDNGPRPGRALLVRRQGDGRVVGVMAQAGRWVKVLAVARDERRRGIGTALLRAAGEWCRSLGPSGASGDRPRLRIGDHPGNYLSPGLDERYQEGRAFLAARGYKEVARNQNLRAELAKNPLVTRARAEALAGAARARGYAIRRAGPADAAPLLDMVAREFSPVWAFEVGQAMEALPEGPGVHAAFALDTGGPVAFAAHDGNNRGLGWFGPMGTLPAHRGRGLGEALLIPCLLDVAARPEGGVIAWVGPQDFYGRACGAVTDRRFMVYEES